MKPLNKQLITKAIKQKSLVAAKKYNNWSIEDWTKVLFSYETHFFVQVWHSKYVSISEGEKFSLIYLLFQYRFVLVSQCSQISLKTFQMDDIYQFFNKFEKNFYSLFLFLFGTNMSQRY